MPLLALHAPADPALARAALVQIAFVLALLLAGRIALAWLPAGRLGSTRPGGVAGMLGASLVLALAIGGAASATCVWLGLAEPSLAALAIGFAAAGLLRAATLPAPFVATPPPCGASLTRPAAAVQLASALAMAAALSLSARADVQQTPLLLALCTFALPALLDHALQELGAGAWPRALVWAGPAATLWFLPGGWALGAGQAEPALYFGAGAAFALVWRLRADRRALSFSVIALGAAAASTAAAWPLSLAGLSLLALSTPLSLRSDGLRWSVAAGLAFTPATLLARATSALQHEAWSASHGELEAAALLAAAALPIAWLALALTWDRLARGKPA